MADIFIADGRSDADVRPTIKEQLTLAARCEKCSGFQVRGLFPFDYWSTRILSLLAKTRSK